MLPGVLKISTGVTLTVVGPLANLKTDSQGLMA